MLLRVNVQYPYISYEDLSIAQAAQASSILVDFPSGQFSWPRVNLKYAPSWQIVLKRYYYDLLSTNGDALTASKLATLRRQVGAVVRRR